MRLAAHTTLIALSLFIGTAAIATDASAQDARTVCSLTVRIGQIDAPLPALGADSARIRAMATARLAGLAADTTKPGCRTAVLIVDARVAGGMAGGDRWATVSGRLVSGCPPATREDCGVTWESALPSFPIRSRRLTSELVEDRLRTLLDDLAAHLASNRSPAPLRS